MFRLRFWMPWRRLLRGNIIADWCIEHGILHDWTATESSLHSWTLGQSVLHDWTLAHYTVDCD